ncbi:phosphatidate cytidylyltransferase [Cognatishimia sp. SS12]|uniref:phosphatidate cytidylyltransferase n=1 Tax=Cognatishimia sp. SS12 TaxID=2979465 RepID=UPI002FEDF4FE
MQARFFSAIVMLVVGLGALWYGGVAFLLLIALIGGGMMWELSRIMKPEPREFASLIGLVTAATLCSIVFLPEKYFLFATAIPAFVGAFFIGRDKLIFCGYALGLMFACFGVLLLRDFRGLDTVLWLGAVVVVTDVAGYFAGRILGGPKFWPAVSPKKTWSGTAAGWVASAILGFAVGGAEFAFLSVGLSFASQLGDIAESAIKRRYGVKDSSALIPGHGGLLDRFDGLIAAALLMFVISVLVGLPQFPG